MTTPSLMESLGIDVEVYAPIVRGGAPIMNIAQLVTAYSHEMGSFGWFTRSSITVAATRNQLDDWLANGLGRHIVVRSPAQNIIFEGFVNQISSKMGTLNITIGPLMDIANRVSVVYTPIVDPDVTPPTTGTPTETIITDDADSQDKYNIVERVLSTGTCLPDDAEVVRDTYLLEYKYPRTSADLSFSGDAGDTLVTLECSGYYEWLDHWVYNNPAVITSEMAYQKVMDVLQADPTGIINQDMTSIGYNAVLVPTAEDQNRTALAIIQGILNLGGAYDEKYMFGIGADRKAVYQPFSYEVDYFYRITDSRQRLTSRAQTLLMPWDIVPGKWVMLVDYLVGQSIDYTALQPDPRAIMIESLQFTAPLTLTIKATQYPRLPQLLAKLGLGGL